MFKRLIVFLASLLAVLAIEEESLLRELKEKHQITTLDDKQIKSEVDNFKHLERTQQLLEIKRKIMQTLGGVNDVYRELGLNSIQAKTEILGILRKVQNAPEEPTAAKSVFRKVHENLDKLIRFIPDDVRMQKYGQPPVIPPWQPPAPEWQPPAPEWQPPSPVWPPPQPQPEFPAPEPEFGNWGVLKIVLHPVLDGVRLIRALVNCLLL